MVFDWAEVTSRARIAANRVNPRRVFVAGIVRPHVCLLSSSLRGIMLDGGGWIDGWMDRGGMDGRESLLIATNCV